MVHFSKMPSKIKRQRVQVINRGKKCITVGCDRNAKAKNMCLRCYQHKRQEWLLFRKDEKMKTLYNPEMIQRKRNVKKKNKSMSHMQNKLLLQ